MTTETQETTQETAPETTEKSTAEKLYGGQHKEDSQEEKPSEETAPETKPEEETTPKEGEKEETAPEKEGEKEKEETAPEGAPESYDNFKLPEGFEMSPEQSTEIKEFAKENNWTQAQAQQGVDFHMKFLGEYNQKLQDQQKDMRDGWESDSKGDKEIGGPDMDQKLSESNRVVKQFSPPAQTADGKPVFRVDEKGNPTDEALTEYGALMQATGLGNHPAVVRFNYRLSQAIGEDFKFVEGQQAPVEKTRAERMFPKQGKD